MLVLAALQRSLRAPKIFKYYRDTKSGQRG